MFDRKYPYTTMQEYNLDWILERIRTLTDEWKETHDEWEDVKTEWESYKHYFDTLDVQDEINNKINEMIADGTFDEIVAPFFADAIGEVPEIVTNWINDNLSQQAGYVVDASLTIVGASADAKAVGSQIRDIVFNFSENNRDIITHDIDVNKVWETTTGNKINFNDRISSHELIPISEPTLFISSCGYPVTIVCYDENKQYLTYVIARDLATFTGSVFQGTSLATKYIGLNVNTNGNVLNEISIHALTGQDVVKSPFISGDNYLYLQNKIIQNGTLSTNSNYDVVLLPCKEGDKFYINSRGQHNFSSYKYPSTFLSEASYTNIERLSRIYTMPSDTNFTMFNIPHASTHGGEMSRVVSKITKNEKILAIGGSYTWLDNSTGGYDGSTLFLGWQKILEEDGFEIESAGYNGYTYATGVSGVGSMYTEIVTNNYDVSNYDIIILFGGSNDILYNVPLGTRKTSYNDHSFDSDTFNGALGGIIYYIRQNNPSCKIILCSPIKSEASSRDYNNSEKYIEEISYNSSFWSCYYNDLFRTFNTSPYTNNFSDFYYDNTHPNKSGMERLGELMLKAVKNC